MLTLGNPALSVLLFALGIAMLRLNLWRAWLALWPGSIRLYVEDPGEVREVPAALEPTHDALRALGFKSLGSHVEHPRFGAATLFYDYAHPTDGVFASLSRAPDWGVRFSKGLAYVPRSEAEGPVARVVLLTPSESGGFVVSANARRPGAEIKGRYLSGALVAAPVDRLFKAHLRRVSELGIAHADWSIEGRLDAARRLYGDVGKTELRQQHAVGLLWTLGALGIVAASIIGSDGAP